MARGFQAVVQDFICFFFAAFTFCEFVIGRVNFIEKENQRNFVHLKITVNLLPENELERKLVEFCPFQNSNF